MIHRVLAEKLFLGKTQSDKLLDPGWTRVIFMQFKIKKEREKNRTLWKEGREVMFVR